MNIVVHGNTSFAWTAALQMAALGNQVTLCPAWSVLITTPEVEVAREHGLAPLLAEVVEAGRLRFACGLDFTSADSPLPDHHWLAHDGGTQRLFKQAEALLNAACMRENVLQLPVFGVLTPFPVGTLPKLRNYLHQVADYFRRLAVSDQREAPAELPLVFSFPLFIRAGTALGDFMAPPLLLLGCDDEDRSHELLEALRPVVRRAREVMIVPLPAAELIKVSVNAMLATRMSFMNEVASLCERLRVDVDLVRQGLSADPRIGTDYLVPGCGFGGPSFSSEVMDFSQTLRHTLDRESLIGTAMTINQRQREVLFRKLWRYFRGDLAGRCIAIWGAAYKPGSASVQDSAVHPLLQALWAQGARTRVYDPLAGRSLAEQYPDQPLLTVVTDPYEALQGCPDGVADASACTSRGADALVLVTACDEFQSPDFRRVRTMLSQPVIFDGRNVYDPAWLKEQGFSYVGIGRGDTV